MKINFLPAKDFITRTTGRAGLVLKQHSPEILIGVGIVGLVGAGIMACKATLKVGTVMAEHQEKLDKIVYAKQNIDKEDYSEEDAVKDTIITNVQTAVEFVKLYGPSVTLAICSIICILSSNKIMRGRNVALAAAYKAVEESFSSYRARVREELGEERELQFKRGLHTEVENIIEVDEAGNKKKVKKESVVANANQISQYARFFDETSRCWEKFPEYNLSFLLAQQNLANHRLQAVGHVFLNEVYDMLGLERSKAGQVVGWVKNHGDNYIDFGIHNIDRVKSRDFVNGHEPSILLDFNVDGEIWSLFTNARG